MKRVVLIHGNGGGTGSDNWFPYVKHALETTGIACITPDMPDPVLARSKYWLPYIEHEIHADRNTVLVGHSSGAVAALRYAENHKVLGLVLVGVYSTDLGFEDEKQSGYFDAPWNWDAIKANASWIVVFASADDPYIPIDDPRQISSVLGAEFIELPKRGHFGGSGDHYQAEFPELVELLKRKLKDG